MKRSELDKILEFSLDMICTIDESGRFVRVSKASYDVLGYHPAELTGKPYMAFVYPEDYEITRAFANEVTSGAPVCMFKNRYIHKEGHIIPVLWSSNWDSEERILYCIARNGSAKQQAEALRVSLEESNKRYEYVTKATSDAIWDWDIKKGSLFWGEGYYTIFGYKPEETKNDINSWKELIHPEDFNAVISGLERAINTGEMNWKMEYRFKRADGSYAYVVDRGFLIRDEKGSATRMVGAVHDISERKKSLAQLKKFADDLYKRNRELQQFGYVVSHNLRSPVANIIGIAGLMDSEKDNPETIEFCIQNLKTSISRLDEVILDLSKILTITDNPFELDKESVNLAEILEKVVGDLGELVVRTQCLITLPKVQVVLRSHKAYLYSIFYNLISNAIKYRSNKKPEVLISIADTPTQVVIEITDNGIGIDTTKHQKDLYKPYKRFNYDKEGKGLGLFLVRSHVEALQGEIMLKSELGKGSTFSIMFPKNDTV